MSEENLIALCRPETLSINKDQHKRLPGELKFWADPAHQLWVKDNSEAYSLVRSFSGGEPTPLNIASVVNSLLMGIEMPSILDARYDVDGVAKLMTILSCALAVSDFSVFGSEEVNRDSLDDLQRKFLPAESRANASNELSEVIAYGHFLGFFEPAENGGHVVDPTEAVATALKEVLEPGVDVGIQDLLAGVAEKLPVLDNGRFRREVEEKMEERGFRRPPKDRLSRTMSHALYRLRIAGVIKLEELSDDPYQVSFDLPLGEKRFSRIRLMRAEG